jgi:molybdopterin converting factor small subunit
MTEYFNYYIENYGHSDNEINGMATLETITDKYNNQYYELRSADTKYDYSINNINNSMGSICKET